MGKLFEIKKLFNFSRLIIKAQKNENTTLKWMVIK